MFPKYFHFVLLVVVSLQLKDTACFFVRPSRDSFPHGYNSGYCISDTGQIQSIGTWGNLSFLAFSDNSCLDPAAQFRFRDNGAMLNLKRQGCLAALHRNGSGYDLDMFYLYVDSVSLDTAACAQKPNESIYRAITQTPRGALSVYYKGVEDSSFQTWCAYWAYNSRLYENYGIVRYVGLLRQCNHQGFIFGSMTCHGDKVKNANCPKDQYMVVKFATYRGLLAPKTCGLSLSDDYSCEVDVTCLVKKQCDGLHECNITVDDNLFSGDLCPRLSNYLYFEYHCVDTVKPFNELCVYDVALSYSSLPYKGVVQITIDGGIRNVCWHSLHNKAKETVCRHFGYKYIKSLVNISTPTDAKNATFSGSINCKSGDRGLAQCSITASTNESCSELSYIECSYMLVQSKQIKPLFQDKQRFPDSSFSASASSEGHSASDARISSGSSWCAPVSDDKHYLQVDLGRLYYLHFLATYGDSTSPKWVATYNLNYTIDLAVVNWNTFYKILQGNKNAYGYMALEDLYIDARALRFISLTYVGQPCMRVDIWGRTVLPDKPTNLTVTSVTSRSAEISWLDPKNPGRDPLSRFWIKLNKENSPILNISITTGKVNKYKINNLTPYTTYEISVVAGSDYGFGEESNTLFSTSEEAPSGPPLNIRTTSRNASSLSFAWDPPDTTKQNGVIISYTACVSHFENGPCFQTFVTSEKKWLVIDLNPLTKYYVRVLASTKVGHGNYSESKGFFTSGILLPVNLTVTNITSRSAEISWQDPKDHKRFGLSRFWIQLKKENFLILNITTGKVNKYKINNLTPYTTYEISVAAGNDYGFGEESNTSFSTSEEAPRGPPLNIKTTSRNASSLSLAWDPPEKTKQNGVIISYTACVSHFENGPCFQTFFTSEKKWLVIDLNPSTKYYVRVLASTKVGHGNYSESKGFFTSGNIVLLPLNLTVTNIKSRSAEISWPDPKDHGRFGVSRFWIKLKKENSLILNITTGKVNKYKINNLTPYTTYEISVTAGNDYGFGEESNTSFSTSEEAPSGPPLNIRTTSRSASSLSFAWDPPDKTEQNGIIINYTACVSHFESGLCFQTFITSERKWLVGNLYSLTKYYVRVLASTKVGHGNYSESKRFFTSGNIVLLPINLTVTNIKSRSAEISWPDPKDHGRFGLSRFWIKLKKENSLILNITTGKVNEYEINNLTPYTTYEVSIAPGNDYGFGEESNTSFLTSEEAPSGPPLNIRTTSRSATSLFFTWDPPDTIKQNGVIISYKTCLSYIENEPCFQTFTTSERKWLVRNLNPSTKYYVRVLASTKVGHGNYSESEGFFTNGKPAEKAIAETSSTLTFSLKIPSETFVYFYVVALKLKDGKEPVSSDSYQNNELVTYAEAGKSSNPKPYIAAVVASSGVDGNMFVLGDGRNTSNSTSRKRRSTTSGYFNGPLEPGTSYSVFQRIIINEMGEYYSTDWSPPSNTSENTDRVPGDVSDTDDNDGSEKYLVAIIIPSAILLVILCVIAYCIYTRRLKSSTDVDHMHLPDAQHIDDDDDVGKSPGEDNDDHFYGHVNPDIQNVYADEKETGI